MCLESVPEHANNPVLSIGNSNLVGEIVNYAGNYNQMVNTISDLGNDNEEDRGKLAIGSST